MRFENYMSDCLAEGKLLDIEAYTDFWHHNDTGVSLREFLGMTDRELERWIKGGDAVLPELLRERVEQPGISFPAKEEIPAKAPQQYRKVYYRINCPSYQFDRGFLSEQGEAAFKEETRWLFQEDGWELLPERIRGASDTFIRGKERLYLHPMNFSGEVKAENIPAIKALLSTAKTFSCYGVDRYDAYLELSPEELRLTLEAQKERIAADLLEAFQTPHRNSFHYGGAPLDQVKRKYATLLIDERDHEVRTYQKVVNEIFLELVRQGKILSRARRYRAGFRTATPKDKNKQPEKKTA